MAIALDGYDHAANSFGGSYTQTLSLTTTQANDIVMMNIWTFYGAVVSSVVGATLGGFTYLGGSSNGGAGSGGAAEELQIWGCFASGALTSEVITVTQGSNYDYRYDLSAWSGSNQTSLTGAFEPFIGNENGGFSGTLPQDYTTTNANTAVIGFAGLGFGGNASTAGNGFTFIGTPADNIFTSYKILSAPSTETISIDLNDYCVRMVGYAIIEAAGGGGGGAKGRVGLQNVDEGFAGSSQRFGSLHPIGKGIVGWRRGLILPKREIVRVTHTRRAA